MNTNRDDNRLAAVNDDNWNSRVIATNEGEEHS
jgi:hypothetical protein